MRDIFGNLVEVGGNIASFRSPGRGERSDASCASRQIVLASVVCVALLGIASGKKKGHGLVR
jgi:hypothetical protein